MNEQPQTFETFIEQERTRLNQLREDALNRKAVINTELAEIDRELSAIAAYEAAKRPAPPPKPRGTRRAGRRDAVLEVIKQHPDGIGRGEIIEAMGAKGTKSEEQSVSNALTNLSKQGQVDRRDRKYFAL